MHSVQLVVEGHGEVGGSAGGHVGDKGGLALVDRVVHVDPALADLHVLEAGLDAVRTEEEEGVSDGSRCSPPAGPMITGTQTAAGAAAELRTVCCVGNRADATW